MAQFTFTLDDTVAANLVEAFAVTFKYRPTVPDPANPGNFIENPVTPQVFAQQQFVLFGKRTIKNYMMAQSKLAAASGIAAAQAAIDAAVITIVGS